MAKQKAVSVALWEQKLTTFEELYNEATPEERKDLLRLHINHLVYTPDGIQLALFDPSNEADRPKVQRDGTSGSPTIPSTELFCVWDHFPIHHFRRNKKPIIAIGHKPQKQFVTQKLHHPNYLKRATYYHELLDKGYVQSQTELAKQVGISRTKTRLILRLLKLDEEIKDFILSLDDSDPRLSAVAVYRLQPLLQLKSKERQRRKFWQMIEDQYPGQSTCYEKIALSRFDS